MEWELYDWQKECLERWFANDCRGMVQAVTGAGKTRMALAGVRYLEQSKAPGLNVKIVVPTGALMRQWHHTLKKFLEEEEQEGAACGNPQKLIGRRGDGNKDATECKYMIYVINSARYELARRILTELKNGGNVLLIADECHHYVSGQNRLIFEFMPYIKPYEKHFFSMGLSACLPNGQTGRELASVLGRKIYSYGMKQAFAGNTVSRYDIYHVELGLKREEREEYLEISDRIHFCYRRLLVQQPFLKDMKTGERFELLRSLCSDRNRKTAETAALYLKLIYKRQNLVCHAAERIECAEQLVRRLGIRNRILIFGERIRQAEELYTLLEKDYPGRIGRYHSGLGQQANKNALERFKQGDIRILIACRAVDEGVDVPEAAIGIILSGTSAQRQRIQRLGRIIRKKEGKDRASLYYLHVPDTAEEEYYLPQAETNHIFELQYDSGKGSFLSDEYRRAADELLNQMRSTGMEQDILEEAERCLALGVVRSDWLLSEESIKAKIREAETVGDRNYWTCMKKLGEKRK